MHALRCLVTGLALGISALLSGGEAAPPVELITDTTVIQPTTTLEFRFARAMIGREEVGITPPEPPIAFSPAMPGQFTWLSRSSGVFVPKGPLPLGVTYTVTLRKGLRWADGKAVPASRWTLQTPRFGQTAVKNPGGEDVSPPRPRVMLAYNLPIDLKSAEELFQFVDTKGKKVAAKVRHGTNRDYFYLQLEQRDWNERWHAARPPSERPDAVRSSDDEDEAGGEEPEEESELEGGDYGADGKPISA